MFLKSFVHFLNFITYLLLSRPFAEIYLHSNILRSQAKCSVVSTTWNIPCSTEGRGGTFVSYLKVWVRSFFFLLLKCKGGPTLFLEKNTKIPQLPHYKICIINVAVNLDALFSFYAATLCFGEGMKTRVHYFC